MNTLSRRLMTLCLCLTATPALCASKVDVTLTGSITPSACTPVLLPSGIVDHGRVPARSLNQYEFTELPMRTLDMSVTCNHPVLFVLVGVDNRAESSVGPGFYYGLGNNIYAPAERLGSVAVAIRDAVGDGQRTIVLASSNRGLTWFPETNAYPDNYMGFAHPGTLVPDPHSVLTAKLEIKTSINAAAYLTLDQEVPLDGSIVLDLRYL